MATVENTKKILKAKRSVLKGLTTKALKKFCTSADLDQVQLQYEKICENYQRCEEAQTEYLIWLESSDDPDKDKELDYLDKIESEVDELHLFVARKKSDSKKSSQKDKATGCADCADDKRMMNPNQTIFKVNKLEMEVFTGDILKYLQWKCDMETHYLPFVASSMQPIALKKLLTVSIQDKLIGLDQVNGIWKELDRLYGSASKISDQIVLEICEFPNMLDHDYTSFIKFNERLQRADRELRKFDKGHDLDNSHMIGLVEKKLPAKIRADWAEHVVERDISKDKFKKLLEFIKRKAQAKEYEAAAIRTDQGLAGLSHFTNNNRTGTFENFGSSESSACAVHFRQPANHQTEQCNTFLAMNPNERRSALIRGRACFKCLKRGHRADNCVVNTLCFIPGCKGAHHGLLHITRDRGQIQQSHNPSYGWNGGNPTNQNRQFANLNLGVNGAGASLTTTVTTPVPPSAGTATDTTGTIGQSHHQQSANSPNPMLPLQGITTKGKHSLCVLFDSGSTVSLICESVARGLELPAIGQRTMNLVKTGGESDPIHTPVYEVPFIDSQGEITMVTAYGLRRISTDIDPIRDEEIERIFELEKGSLHRPSGRIDVLVGTDVAGLHPTPVSMCGNLILGRNAFGLVAWGAHPNSNCSDSVKLSLLSNATLNDFFQIESMGVECNPRCGSCRCGTCPLGAKEYTIKEERELELVRSGLHHSEGRWVCTYPWIKEPSMLPDNYSFILAQLHSMEKRLRKDPELMRMYSEQMQDMLDRGVAHKCTWQELRDYRGPVFYLSHHEVLKQSSTSTPCRVVFNPSQNFRGHILNDYWALGSNLVQSIFNVLIRFREERIGFVGDIAKMYHSVYTTPLEWHTHRFLWRNCENRPPDVYVFTRNSFGDRPAGTIAIMAIQMTVDKFGTEHPDGSQILQEGLYVDDIVDSRPSMEEAQAAMEDTESLLSKGGFKVKGWTVSSDLQSEQPSQFEWEKQDSDRVLGMIYSPCRDSFRFKMKLNFSRGKHRKSAACDLSKDDVPAKIPNQITKRMIVSQVNGIYDVLGLISPFVVRSKIMLRQLWMQKLDWDDGIREELRNEWIEWFQEAFEISILEFERCVSPYPRPTTEPTLVMFSDASLDAMAAVAYLRFETTPGQFHCRLIAAKTRVTPLQQKTIVQYEMQAAIMSKRLAQSLTQAFRVKVDETMYIVDSEIVRAMISKDSYGFKSWYALRVGEIVSFSEPSQWYWVEGKLNVADWATRGRSPSELDSDSIWQKGPDFLYKPKDEWPTRQSCATKELPGLKSHSTITEKPIISSVMDITRYSSFSKTFRITARLLACIQKRSLCAIVPQPRVADYWKARLQWVIAAQRDKSGKGQSLRDQLEDGKFENLVPVTDANGIYRAKGRLFAEDNGPIILPQWHHLSKLLIREMHERNHEGISTVATKVKETYWIIGATRLAKSVRYQCVTCRKQFGELQKQVMADLPPERTYVSLPFQHVSIDLFGPYELKIPGKSTRGRQFTDEKNAYGVLYSCLSSRAVYVDVARGYSLDAFLLVHRRFQSIRGAPETLYSDSGPQLAAADKALHKKIMKEWSQDELVAHGVKFGTNWKFCAPDSPWQNGVSESLIKGVKRSLTLTLGNHPKLTFEELQTVVFEVGNLLNERPIGRHPTSPDESAYLRPNDLLLGRCTPRINSGPWREPGGDLRKRFLIVQALINDWNKRWQRDYFPTLLPRRKWHSASRSIQVGDLVLVQNEKTVRGQWTLGQVNKIHPSDDGRIRNVDIRYKNFPTNEPTHKYAGSKDSIIKRSVQRLVVICPVEEMAHNSS